MSSFRARLAQKLGLSPKPGNCANAPFFLDMALANTKAALANLDRAERDCPGIVEPRTRAALDVLIHHMEIAASRSREREPIRAPVVSPEDEYGSSWVEGQETKVHA